MTTLTLRIGSTTYRVQSATSGNAAFQIWTTPRLPQDAVKGWQLVVNRGPNGGTSTYTLREGNGIWAQEGNAWSSDHAAEITLYRPYEDIAAEDMRKTASRSSSACPGAVDAGPLWHCHGDAVYHQHEDWNKAHNTHKAAKDLRPTGDPVIPRPPATASEQAGWTGWHWHGDIYHRHGTD